MDYVGFVVTSFFALFAAVDPIGNVPFYVSLTEGLRKRVRLRIIKNAMLTALVTLSVFALAGNAIFSAFGITIPAFRIAGGILLLKISFSMLHGEKPRTKQTHAEKIETLERMLRGEMGDETAEDMGVGEEEDDEDERDHEAESVAFVPLGIPLFAGPGSITLVIILMSEGVRVCGNFFLSWLLVFISIVAIVALSYVVLFYADPLFERMGRTGVLVFSRIFGLILAAMAIQFIITGAGEVVMAWYNAIVAGGTGGGV